MKIIFIIFLFILSIQDNVHAKVNCDVHKIYCKIIELNSKVDKKYAMNLSNLLYKYSKKYGTDPIISVGIMKIESGISKIDRTTKGYIFYKECDDIDNCELYYKKQTVHTDIGEFQFHISTIEYHNLDPIKLKTNMEYNVKNHIKLLKTKMIMCKGMPYSWGCWHSKTTKYKDRYVKKVLEVLNSSKGGDS